MYWEKCNVKLYYAYRFIIYTKLGFTEYYKGISQIHQCFCLFVYYENKQRIPLFYIKCID